MVRGSLAAFLSTLVAISLFVVPPVGAQSPDAPDPGPEFPVIYAHHNDDGTNDDELVGYMNTMIDDPDSDDIAMGDSQAACTVSQLPPPVNPAIDRTWTLNLAPQFKGAVELDPAGMFVVTAHIGAGSGIGGSNLQVTTKLVQGSIVVFDGAAVPHSYQAGAGQYPNVTWSLAPKVTTLAANADMTWTIHVTGPSCSAQGLFLGVHEDRGKSNFVLPTVGGTAAVEFFNLTGDAAEVSVEATEPTTASHQYNWTTDQTALRLEYSAEVSNGSVSFEVIDGGNKTAASGILNATGNDTVDLSAVNAGDWRILVNLTDFAGTFELTIAAPPDGTGGADAPSATTSAGGSTGNASAQAAGGDDKGIPGPHAAVLMVSIAAAVVLSRRRR